MTSKTSKTNKPVQAAHTRNPFQPAWIGHMPAGAADLGSLARCATVAVVGLAALLLPLGCRQAPPANTPAPIIDNNAGPDPAAANLAPADAYPAQPAPAAKQPVRVLGSQAQYTPQQSAESYPQQQPAYNNGHPVPPPSNGYDSGYDSGVNAGYEAVEEASQPPPPLPEYEQPPAPEPNDLWTPGYWNYASAGYFWVPGAWVGAPYAGALWTPGYWGGYGPNRYRFHHGFWARHIGFYGGINYGYGYTGSGYEGGYWRGNDFFYNRAVNRVNVTNIHNVYERNVTINNVTRVSYNGGNGGLEVRPRPQEIAVLHEQRIPAMASQIQVRQEAAGNRQQFFSENHGHPALAAAARPIPAERGVQAPSAQPQNHIQQAQPLEQPRGQQVQQQRLAQEQRPTQDQERTQQLQQHNVQVQQQQQQQRAAQDQQRTQQQQQSNAIRQQQQENAAHQQRTVQPQQTAPPPRAVQPQHVVPPVTQHLQAAPPQVQQPQRIQPQPQRVQPQAPSQQPQRAQPQAPPQQPQHVQPQAQPQHVERAQPQAQPHAEPYGNEGRPR